MQAGPCSLATTYGISVDFFSSGYLDVSVRRVRRRRPMYSVWATPKGGFPHSDICGSKVACHLPAAFRRLPRPSSPVIAKASTICAWSLDPTTFKMPVAAPRHLVRVTTAADNSCRTMQSLPISFAPLRLAPAPCELHVFTSFRLLKSDDSLFSQENNQQHRTAGSGHALLIVHFWWLVEADGIEPTTPCLQSRCSPS